MSLAVPHVKNLMQEVQEKIDLDYRHRGWSALESVAIGTAGEHIACADLLLQGYKAFLTSQGLAYDLIVDVGGRLLRVAVKSTTRAKPRPAREGSRICYQFAIGRSRRRSTGRTDRRAYSTNDVDVVAMVALDQKRVAYLPMARCSTFIHIDHDEFERGRNKFGPKGIKRRKFDDLTFSKTLEAINAASV